jgi:hypothetical protein
VHPDGSIVPVNGPAFPFYVATIGMYAFQSFILLGRSYRKTSGRARSQVQYFSLGIAAFILFAFASNALLPAYEHFQLNLAGPISSVVFVGFTAYAIVRHHLLDIRVVIQRSAIYLFLLLLLVGLYISLVFALGEIFRYAFDVTVLTSAGLSAVVGAFGVPLLERYFRRVTDRIFFKDKYDYAEALKRLSGVLNRNLEPADIAKELGTALAEVLRAERVGVLLNTSCVRAGSSKEAGSVEEVFPGIDPRGFFEHPPVMLVEDFPLVLADPALGAQSKELSCPWDWRTIF